MKLITCLPALCFVCSVFINAHAQNDISLPGVIAMQNSHYKTGHKIYIAAANVKSTTKCTPTTSDSKGEFTLVFSDKPAGDAVTVFVDKDGLEVVNDKDLEEAAIVGRLAPLQIYMCKKGDLEANKEAYYLISDSAIQSIYNLRLKALLQKEGKEYNAVIASLEKELKDTIKNSDEAIAALNQQLQTQKKQVKDVVDQFAIVNLDDQSETYQRAFAAFTKGDIDTALAILDSVDLEKRLQTNTEQVQKEQAEDTAIKENIALKQQQIHEDIEQALLDARMHKLKYQFKETEASYDLVLKYDSLNFEAITEYYYFLEDTKNYQKAIVMLENSLKNFQNIDQTDYLVKWHTAVMQTTIGICYFELYEYSESEKAYNKGLLIENELAEIDPEFYLPKIAGEKFLLALLYEEKKDYNKAEPLFLEALNAYKKLSIKNQEAVEPDIINAESSLAYFYSECKNDNAKAEFIYNDALQRDKSYGKYDVSIDAILQDDMGQFYMKQHEYAKADTFLNNALALYKSEASENFLEYGSDIVDMQVDLGNLYRDEKNYKKADSIYKDALKAVNNLIKSNANGFLPQAADIKSNLGILYDDMKNYADAESYYLESLDMYQNLSYQNPVKYKPEIARTQNNMGLMYENKKDYIKAEQAFLIALNIRDSSVKSDSSFYGDLAVTQNDFGAFYEKTGDHVKSESFYLKSLDINKRLSVINPKIYEQEVARTANNLGLMYENEKDYKKAESNYLTALAIRENLVKSDSVFYSDLSDTYSDLGILYDDTKDYAKSESFYLKSLDEYEHLSKINSIKYKPEIARTENNLGLMYDNKKDYKKAEDAYLNALSIREQLVKSDSSLYGDLGETQNDLGVLYNDDRDYLKAELFYLKSISNYESINKINFEEYERDCFSTQMNLINLYKDTLDSLYNDSIQLKYYNLTVSFYEKLYKKSLIENPLSNIETDDCGDLSWNLLFIKKFKEAEIAANWALQLDSSQTWIKINHAHALLFQGKFGEAEKEYLSLKGLKDEDGKPLKNSILEDLSSLEKAGITNDDVNKIRGLIDE